MPKVKRDYYGLDFYLEHPFSDKWSVKLLYTFSKSYGNTEGLVNSDRAASATSGLNTTAVSTQDNDKASLMERANGYLNNDRRHQFKVYGVYEFNDQWRVGGKMSVNSGRPINCYAHLFPAPASYNNAYYYQCGVEGYPGFHETHRGSEGRTPWLVTFDATLSYTPSWAKGFELQMAVSNLFDTRTPIIYDTQSTSANQVIDKAWMMADYNSPRTVTFTASYEF
jgi:hypothetical protein